MKRQSTGETDGQGEDFAIFLASFLPGNYTCIPYPQVRKLTYLCSQIWRESSKTIKRETPILVLIGSWRLNAPVIALPTAPARSGSRNISSAIRPGRRWTSAIHAPLTACVSHRRSWSRRTSSRASWKTWRRKSKKPSLEGLFLFCFFQKDPGDREEEHGIRKIQETQWLNGEGGTDDPHGWKIQPNQFDQYPHQNRKTRQ